MSVSVRDDRATAEEVHLVSAIRRGDETAFAAMIERHYPAMLVLGRAYVLRDDAAARAVQDAWVAALEDSERFDGSTPLRAWLLRCVVRCAAARTVDPGGASAGDTAPAVAPARFRGGRDAFPGHWRAYPRDWATVPDEVLHGEEVRRVVEDTVAALPVEQRTAIALRDVLGCPAHEACAVLELPEAGLREHLHRARSCVRAALERHFDG